MNFLFPYSKIFIFPVFIVFLQITWHVLFLTSNLAMCSKLPESVGLGKWWKWMYIIQNYNIRLVLASQTVGPPSPPSLLWSVNTECPAKSIWTISTGSSTPVWCSPSLQHFVAVGPSFTSKGLGGLFFFFPEIVQLLLDPYNLLCDVARTSLV